MDQERLLDFAQRYTAAWGSQNPACVAEFYSANGSLAVNSDPPALGRDAIGQAGFERLKAGVEQRAPLGRASTPQDVAEAIAWLVDGARTTTGELLLLDGGMHLGGRQPVVSR